MKEKDILKSYFIKTLSFCAKSYRKMSLFIPFRYFSFCLVHFIFSFFYFWN